MEGGVRKVSPLFVVIAVAVIVSLPACAVAGPCEIGLSASPEAGQDGYGEREGGRRCEGIYVTPVGGKQVELVSLSRGRLWYDLNRSSTLQIRLSGVSGPARVRAVGIPDGLYYQMDAVLADGQTLDWPNDVLKNEHIGPDLLASILFARMRALTLYMLRWMCGQLPPRLRRMDPSSPSSVLSE